MTNYDALVEEINSAYRRLSARGGPGPLNQRWRKG